MRHWFGTALLGLVFLTTPAIGRAQVAAGGGGGRNISDYYAAPGLYGVSWGSPSYGVARTYTNFSSPYGAGYGYGYAPNSLMPGPWGMEMWRPGFSTAGYTYGASTYDGYYRTFPYPFRPYAPPAPLGLYAPYFGPPSYYGW